MLLIYSKIITPRLNYILRFIFSEILGIEYEVTQDHESFLLTDFPKLNYSSKRLSDEFFIESKGLLFEDDIRALQIEFDTWTDTGIFFKASEHSDMPFDILSASFFLLSRYEEYLPFNPDSHGRFEARESISFRNGILHEPSIDIWAYKLKDLLLKKYPELEFKKRTFRYISTIDVDNAYAFLYKGTVRTLGATFRSLLKFDNRDNIQRYQTITGKQEDPFDTYGYFDEIHKEYNIKPIWFFLVGEYGPYDKNVDTKALSFRDLIKRISELDTVGIHPSYESNKSFVRLKNEVKFLQSLIGSKVTRSRQHYLKLLFTETYRNLIDLGICEDYTMGYASEIGFRAGTCTPFNFYDLYREKESCLKIFPFQVMDTTLNQYLKLDVDEAVEIIKIIIKKIKKVDGTFISLWHNETLSDHGHWKGWEPVYRKMIKYIFEA